MITGNTARNVNVRSQPKVADGNIVGLLKAGSVFTGSVYVDETATRKWIKLLSIDGGVAGGYVAAWVVNSQVVPDVPVGNDEIVSGELTLASGAKVHMVVVND